MVPGQPLQSQARSRGLRGPLLSVYDEFMLNYTQGQLARLSHTFYDGEGNLVDPTFIRFSIQREADGVKEYYEYDADSSDSSNSSDDDDAPPGIVVRDSAGRYHVDVRTDPQSGLYLWRVRSENPIASEQGEFYVEPANLDDESSDDSSS